MSGLTSKNIGEQSETFKSIKAPEYQKQDAILKICYLLHILMKFWQIYLFWSLNSSQPTQYIAESGFCKPKSPKLQETQLL